MMNRRFLTTIISILWVSNMMAYNAILSRYIKQDYQGWADSVTHVLITNFLNTNKGTFYSTPHDVEKSSTYIYWQQAHAMDVLIYGYENNLESNPTLASRYKLYMRRWVQNHANNYYSSSSDGTGFLNPYTDDMCWICLTLIHMGEATETSTYITTAKTVFDRYIITRGKETEDGIMLPWNWDQGAGPNACTNSPACLVAAKLYNHYGTEKYLTYAEGLYNYVVKKIAKGDGRVEEPPLSYTQGTFGEACRQLYHITGDVKYRTMCTNVLNYAVTSGRCVSNGILRHEGTSMDQSIFKAVLIPYLVNYVLDETIPTAGRRTILSFLITQCNTLWKNLDKDAYPQMYSSYYWGEKWDTSKTASMGANTSGASLMENMRRCAISLTTKEDESHVVEISQDMKPQTFDVYTLDGKCLLRGATDTGNLPKGIYIINGRKRVVQ